MSTCHFFKRFLFALLITFSISVPIKAINQPIDFGAQFRVRYEANNPSSFSQTPHRSQDQLLFRTRLHGRTTFEAEKIDLFLQIQDSRVSGSEASVVANSQNVDLHQAYIDIRELGGKSLTLRVGRQELKYGDQRMISTLEWHNVGRSWDGAKLSYLAGPFQLDGFVTIVNEVSNSYEDLKFSGLYGMLRPSESHEIDLYVLSRHSGKATRAGAGPSSNLDEWSVGTRVKGKAHAFDYSGEVVKQLGDTAGADIEAMAFGTTAGVTCKRLGGTRFGLGYDWASGDDNPGDNKNKTFASPFPFGHYYQGHADVFSWKNGGDLYANVTTKIKGLWAQVAFHQFRLHEAKDAWYNAGGAIIAQDSTGASGKDVGHELDIHFKTKFRGLINLWFGYARFWGDDFVKKNVTGSPNKDFVFIQGVLNFD